MLEKADHGKDKRRSACQLTVLQLRRCLNVLSMIYISCILVILLMVVSAHTTYAIHRANVQVMALTIGWWIYYILTVFCAINNFIFLSLLCMNKQTFITDCHTDPFLCTDDSCHGTITDRNDDDGRHSNAMDSSAIIPCFHMWQETVGWVVMDTMMNLIVNVMYIYVLHRCRGDHTPFNQIKRVDPVDLIPPSYPTALGSSHYPTKTTMVDLGENGYDDDEFQVVELK